MDFSKLGLRNVLGITLPGAVLVMVLAYAASVGASTLGVPLSAAWIGENEAIVLSALLLLSYFLGAMLRLNSADAIDRKSSAFLLKKWRDGDKDTPGHDKKAEEGLEAVADRFGRGEDIGRLQEEFDRWIWRKELFPYPLWQFRKLKLYHPEDAYAFFLGYRKCMEEEGVVSGRKGNKEFFNYCKMAIRHASRDAGDALLQEVNMAEANVRFYAGTCLGLGISFWTLTALVAFQTFFLLSGRGTMGSSQAMALLAASSAMAAAAFFTRRGIIRRFRTLRMKEVDAVYDAFYLVHRPAKECPAYPDASSKPANRDYVARRSLLEEVFLPDGGQGGPPRPAPLGALLSRMREGSAGNPKLSSLYFAGIEDDHPYFVKNDRVAVGVSVLPEDEEKAGQAKRHPHQVEAVFVLEGELRLQTAGGNMPAEDKLLRQGDCALIAKGQCHRICSVDGQKASFLFVKTSPAEEPQGLDCSLLSAASTGQSASPGVSAENKAAVAAMPHRVCR